MRSSSQTQAEETTMKNLKNYGLGFEVLKLSDSSDISALLTSVVHSLVEQSQMHLLRSGHGFFHTVLQITSTSCTQIAELLILMVCPARLCSISSHGSGDPSGRQCLGKMPCVCVCSVAQLCLFLCNLMDCQSPLSMVFPMQECWSGFPFASPGDIPARDRTCISCISCIGRQVFYHQVHLGSPFGLQ